MLSLSAVKPFLPLLLTFFGPRAISYYRAVKTAVRTRPPPRPLPNETTRGLNVLFACICFFVFLSLPTRKGSLEQNIFAATGSRLHIPSDVLFTRLSMLRSGGLLSNAEEALKTKLTTPISRQMYLKFGPSTLLNCTFCNPDDVSSYLLYHLPANVILPHMFHLAALGLATSEPLAGFDASRWRNKCSISALALAVVDIYVTMTFTPNVDGNMPSPTGMYWTAKMLRPLAICVFDIIVGGLIYASATNRFLLFSSPADSDPVLVRRKQEEMLSQTNVALQMAQTKLRAFSVARNATVRNPDLKSTDDEYWRAVVGMEGPSATAGVWEDEEVQAAMARSFGEGTVDVAQMQREATAFVTSITRGLENNN